MSELVARTGRHQQRYKDGYRLIAGCIPFKYTNVGHGGGTSDRVIEVLMINSTSGPGLLFPKGGWENDETAEEAAEREAMEEAGVRGDLVVKKRNGGSPFSIEISTLLSHHPPFKPSNFFPFQHFLGYYPFKSKTLQDECSPEGLCRAAMYALHVKEELESWPEKSQRDRSWLTIPEAIGCCRHLWMREALGKGFTKWYADGMISTLPKKGLQNSSEDNH